MSGEMIAILAVGVALVGVILTSLKGTETRLREDMAKLEFRLGGKIGALESQIGEPPRAYGAPGRVCWKACARPSPGGPPPAKGQKHPSAYGYNCRQENVRNDYYAGRREITAPAAKEYSRALVRKP